MTCVKYKSHMTMMKIWNFLSNYPWMMKIHFLARAGPENLRIMGQSKNWYVQ